MTKTPLTKRISKHKHKPSFWKKHPLASSSLLLLLLAVLLSALLSSPTFLETLSRPLYHATLLWHRVQWTVFTEGKARLRVNTDLFDVAPLGSPASLVQQLPWNDSLVAALLEEGNEGTQSFLVAQVARGGVPVLLRQGPAKEVSPPPTPPSLLPPCLLTCLHGSLPTCPLYCVACMRTAPTHSLILIPHSPLSLPPVGAVRLGHAGTDRGRQGRGAGGRAQAEAALAREEARAREGRHAGRGHRRQIWWVGGHACL
jgi:hypothetical protein